ncbi:MAG: glycosyltransferase family 39 protein [Chloroflexi bacterium]|nr:glycosyltransferase family 39 protein [Chloroflexota bacterium]
MSTSAATAPDRSEATAGNALAERTHAWPLRRLGSPAVLVLFFVVAFSVRTVGIHLFITPDEDNWMRRTGNFALALQERDFLFTFQSGHPGVTTTWIAALGLGSDAVSLSGITGPDPVVTELPGFMDLLVRARLALIAVNSLLLVGTVALAWRLVGRGPALIGGVLLTFDPFMVAHSQVVHVDALASGFITVALLGACVYWWHRGGWGYLAVCGIASGLAVLTKAPSLILGLLLPLVALTAPLVDRSGWTWRRAVVTLVTGGMLGVLTVMLLLPALWVAPLEVAQRAIDYQIMQGSTPHRPGNYFLGQAKIDPGPWYYPVAILFRLTPLVLVGLVTLAVFLPERRHRRMAVLLIVYVAAFVLFVTAASKKLDRYALPVFPSLALLGGLGLWILWERAAAVLQSIRWGVPERVWAVGALALLAVAHLLPLSAVYPYPLAYYNPLVGGGPTAVRVMLVGWGEGLDQVAGYLNAQPDADRAEISIYYPLEINFQGMVRGHVGQFGDGSRANYVVDYVNGYQRGQIPIEVRAQQPDFTVAINGIVYARVFRIEPPRAIQPLAPVVPLEP